jgi:hypothetical protein
MSLFFLTNQKLSNFSECYINSQIFNVNIVDTVVRS